MEPRRLIIVSIIGTGITSVATQLVTLREFLTQFQGNEITISLALFCWLWLTGMGSFAAKWVKQPALTCYCMLILVIALWPVLQLIVIRKAKDAFFVHGVSPGFYPIFFYILICVMPYCLLTGFVLPYSQKLLNALNDGFKSRELYLFDSIGDLIGGSLFSFVLVSLLTPFLTIAVTSTLLILTAFLLLFTCRRFFFFVVALVPAISFYYFTTNIAFEKQTLLDQYGHLVQYLESPFGRVVISKEGSQYTLWESGIPVYSESNVIKSEEKVHYPLSQADRVKDVLLISGGLGETIGEVSKYHPESVDYVELDPYLTKAALELDILRETPGLNIINMDGRAYMRTTRKRYDAIIIDLPDPDTFQVNRFFTGDFFSLAKDVLRQGGLVSIGIEYSPNYMGDLTAKKLSIIYNTVQRHFENVLVIPGEEAYFLCRDKELWADIPLRLKQKSINTSYIEGFFYGNVTTERIQGIKDALDQEAQINTDFEPRLVNIVFQEWFMKYGTSPTAFLFFSSAIFLTYVFMIRKEELVLFTTGFATMGVEMLIIFAFQVIYGYIYLQIGAIVTAFLLGLLPGVIVGGINTRKTGLKLVVSEILFLAFLVLFFVWAEYGKKEFSPIFFLLYGGGFSFVCGFQFPIVTNIMGEGKSPAAGCLAADLMGAALGTLVVGTILIPLWGIQAAVVVIILVKLMSSLFAGRIAFGEKV